VRVRPLVDRDGPALSDAFARMSHESRTARFGGSGPALTEAVLRHLVGSVDGVDHVAFAAFVDGGDSRIVGVGRILRYADDPDTLDFGVAVADAYQGQGLGSALAAVLDEHRPRPSTRLVTEVAPGNERARRLLRAFGTVRSPADDSRVEVELHDADSRARGSTARLNDSAAPTG
jgi:RimJ/RimL family protein N-acetyltransferase